MTGLPETPGTGSPAGLPVATQGAEFLPHDRRMLEALVCPLTQAVLTYDRNRQELVSRAARLAYPIRDGIPIMLVSEARPIGD